MTKDTMTEEEPMVTDKERREAARELRGYGFDVLKDGSLLSTLKDVTGRSCWRDGDGEYWTGISSVEESVLREWADRIRKLAEKKEE